MTKEVAIDLGTATTQVVVRGELIIDEPTVAAVKLRSGEVIDIGRSALSLVESSPETLEAVWPMQSGVVDDDVTLHRFLNRLIRPLAGGFMERMRLVAAVPSASTPIERRTLVEAARRAGASEVHLVENVVAAALGAGLPVHEPVGSMVVNIGAGLTEAALLSLGSVVAQTSVRAGGADVDEAIRDCLRRNHGMRVTDGVAEEIKRAVSVLPDGAAVEARGELVLDGSTVTAVMESHDISVLIDRHVDRVVEAVKNTLVGAPPELAQDVILRGVHLAGGGAHVAKLSGRLAEFFTLPVHVIPNPEHVVALGAGKCAEAIEDLKPLFVTHRPRR